MPTGDYDAHYAHLNYIIQLIRLGCEFRDVNCDTVDLPSSVPDQKEGEYVYVFSPPEDNSKFPMRDVHVSGSSGTRPFDQSTASNRSTANRQFAQGHAARTTSDHNSITNKLIRSFRRSRSKSPQPEDSLSGVPPNLRPSSPYLLDYSSNRGSSSMEVSLDTFPSQTPQQGDEEIDSPQTSATKRLLSLFQWRRRKQGSYTVAPHKSSTLPPGVHSQQRRGEEEEEVGWADEHRGQFQTSLLSQSQSTQRHNQSLSRDFGASSLSNNTQRVHRSYRPSTFSGADSFAVSSSGTVLGGEPNIVTVEVEVHNVDESLELNSESPVHNPRHHYPAAAFPTNSYSINSKSTESTDREFLSVQVPEGATAPSSKKSSSHHSRRRILSFGTAKDAAAQKKLQHQQQQKKVRPKSRTVLHDRTHHLRVPLLDEDRRQEEIGSCSDSDGAGEDSSYYIENRSSSARTVESSFTAAEDGWAQQSTSNTDTPLGTAATNSETVVVDYMSEEFVGKLEWNFKKDHLLRESCTNLKEAVSDTIKQGQVSVYPYVHVCIHVYMYMCIYIHSTCSYMTLIGVHSTMHLVHSN